MTAAFAPRPIRLIHGRKRTGRPYRETFRRADTTLDGLLLTVSLIAATGQRNDAGPPQCCLS
jgi:hypothetical protein